MRTSRRRAIDDELCARMYEDGVSLVDIAEHFGVSMVAVHYSLQRSEVDRDRWYNPKLHKSDLDNIQQRLYRYTQRLQEAVDDDDLPGIKKYSALVIREKQNLAQQKICRMEERIGELNKYVQEA